jgi:hypothetical protein
MRCTAKLKNYRSIYPEVRASVPPTDDDVPSSTIRGWVLASICTLVINGLNQLFQMHNPPRKYR